MKLGSAGVSIIRPTGLYSSTTELGSKSILAGNHPQISKEYRWGTEDYAESCPGYRYMMTPLFLIVIKAASERLDQNRIITLNQPEMVSNRCTSQRWLLSQYIRSHPGQRGAVGTFRGLYFNESGLIDIGSAQATTQLQSFVALCGPRIRIL